MSEKYNEFLNDLEEICRKHRVQIHLYDVANITDLKDGEAPIMPDFCDGTTEDPKR